jgi:predicted metalloenzyme YecM
MKKHLFLLFSLIVGTCALWAENPEWNVVGQTVSISHTLAGNTAGSWAYEEEKDSETGAYPATFVVLTEATARDLALIPEREKSYEPQSFANSGLKDIDRLILEPLSDDNELLGTVAFKHASLNTTMVEYACLRYSIPYQIAKMHTTYDSEGNAVKREIFYYKVTEIVDENISGSNYVNALVIPHTIEYVPQNAHLDFVNTDTVWMLNAHCRYENGAGNLLPKNKLSTIVFADGFDTIPDQICSSAEELDSVCIPNSVTYIGALAFAWRTGLTSIEIPNSVTSIGQQAFCHCSLTSVIIPNSVTSIGSDAFGQCSSLTSISVDEGNLIYDSRNNCNAIIETASNMLIAGCQNTIIPSSVTSIGSFAFYGCSGLTSIDIGNNVTSIGAVAFWESGLTSVTIPNSVTSMFGNPFAGCSSLISIRVEDENPVYDSRGNCNAIIRTAHNMLIAGCKNTVIPNSVTTIEYGAFSGYSGLNAIEIPNSVTNIGPLAFSNCSGLTAIDLPNSVTKIGGTAFYGCSSLTSLIIGNGVTSIGESAFMYCSSLASIICRAIVPPTMDNSVFSGVDKSIPLFVPAGSVETYRNTEGWNEFTNILPIQVAEVTEEMVADITAINQTSVLVKWPKVENAETYKVVITSEGDTACVLTFDADGSLVSHRFFAIARRANRQNAQAASLTTNGWQYVITGLDENKQYTYSLTVTDADDAILLSQSVAFTTSAPQGIEDVLANPSAAKDGKFLHDGQIYIFRDGKVYDLTGRKL